MNVMFKEILLGASFGLRTRSQAFQRPLGTPSGPGLGPTLPLSDVGIVRNNGSRHHDSMGLVMVRDVVDDVGVGNIFWSDHKGWSLSIARARCMTGINWLAVSVPHWSHWARAGIWPQTVPQRPG